MNIKFTLYVALISFLFISCGSNDTEQYIGIWSGDVNCDGETDPLTMAFTLGSDDDEVLIDFQEDGAPIIRGTIDGDNLTLEETVIPDGEEITNCLNGSGSINNNDQLIMTFIIDVKTNGTTVSTRTCSAILSR